MESMRRRSETKRGARSVGAWLVWAGIAGVGVAGCGDSADTTDDGSTRGGATSSGTGAGGGGTGGADVLVPIEGASCAMVNPLPEAVPDGAFLEDDAIKETLAAIHAFLDTRAVDPDLQADAGIVRAFVETVPHVFDSGIGPDCSVWMRLTDGTPVSIFKDREGYPEGQVEPPPGPAPAPRPPGPTFETRDVGFTQYGLPESIQAFVGMSDNLAPSAIDRIALALQDRGYKVAKARKVTLVDLRTKVKGLGAFWLSSHGAMCGSKAFKKANFCLSTDDVFDPYAGGCLGSGIDCDSTAADRKAGLVGFLVNDLGPGRGTRTTFAITPDFISTYWTFAPNSVVFLDACLSMSPIVLDAEIGVYGNYAGLLRDAVKKAGAGTLLGWNAVASSGFASNTAHLFFDRMLGTNAIYEAMPANRPFSAREVYAALVQQNRVTDPAKQSPGILPATLVLEQLVPTDTILVPSIRNMVIGDPENAPEESELASNTKLTLYGEFGTREVTATVGGSAVDVSTPRSDKAVIVLPGAGASGAVEITVTTQGERIKSNRAPLTSWKGRCRFKATLDGTFGTPGPTTELDCSSAHFRADMHAFRMEPDGPPRPGTAIGMGAFMPAVDFRSTVSDSECLASASGEGTKAGLRTVILDETVPVPWRAMHLPDPGSPNAWYALSAQIDTTVPSQPMLGFLQTHKMYPTADIYFSPMSPPSRQDDFPMSPAPVSYLGQYIPIDASYRIKLDTLQFDAALGNHGELECDLQAEQGTAPTMMTDG